MNNTTTIGASEVGFACEEIWSTVLFKICPLILTFAHTLVLTAGWFEKAPIWVLPGLSIVGSLMSFVVVADIPAFRNSFSITGLANYHSMQNLTTYYYCTEFHLLVDRLRIVDGTKMRGQRRWYYVALLVWWLAVAVCSLQLATKTCYGEDGKIYYSSLGDEILTYVTWAVSTPFLGVAIVVTFYACWWFWKALHSAKKLSADSKKAANFGILKLVIISSLSTIIGAIMGFMTLRTIEGIPVEAEYVGFCIKLAEVTLSAILSVIIIRRIVFTQHMIRSSEGSQKHLRSSEGSQKRDKSNHIGSRISKWPKQRSDDDQHQASQLELCHDTIESL